MHRTFVIHRGWDQGAAFIANDPGASHVSRAVLFPALCTRAALTDELAPSFGVFIDCRNDTTSDQRTGGLPFVCTDEQRPPGHTGYMHKAFAPSATHTLFDCKYCLVKKQDKARYSNIPLQYLLAALAHPGCLPPFSTLQLIVVLIHFSTSFNSIYQAQRPALSKSLPFGTSWRRISKSTTA